MSPSEPRSLPARSSKATLTLAQLVKAIETDLGGRDAVVAALQLVHPRTAHLAGLINLLADPTETSPLLDLCDANHVSPAELLQLYQEGLTARARLRSVRTITEKLPGVVDDVMTRSAPFVASCEGCGGVGSRTADPTEAAPNPSPVPCLVCGGGGKLTYLPDLDRQKVALTLGGLLKAGTGVQITMTQQQAALQQLVNGNIPTPFERVQAAVDQILRDGPPAYAEGEIVDAPPAGAEAGEP